MAGRVLLHKKMKALLFIRNSGIHYKNLRNELENDYTKGIDSYPDTVIDANHRLEYWRPLTVPNVRTGDSHYQGDDRRTGRKVNVSSAMKKGIHSKTIPVAWYCKLRNEYTPFLQEHYCYYLASYFMLTYLA